jgi:hypothetical protein
MPGSSDRTAMSRGLAMLFGAGATLVVVTLLLPHGHDEAQLLLLVPAGLAYVVVAVLLSVPDRLPPAALSLVLACGTVLVGMCVIFSGRAGSAYAFMYVWVALYAAAFFSTRLTVAHLLWLAVVYAVALAISGDVHPPPAHWLLVVGTSSVAAALIHQLSSELRGRASDLTRVTALANAIGGRSEIAARDVGTAICDGVLASAHATAATLYEVIPHADPEAIADAGRPGALFGSPDGTAALAAARASRACERITAGGSRVTGIVEPVVRDARVVGLLAVEWDRPQRLSVRVTAALPLFAAEAGVALDRLADESQERERRALEINDGIVQGLVVARYALTEGRVDVGEKAIRDTLARARALVDEQLESLHGGVAPQPGSLRREGPGIG